MDRIQPAIIGISLLLGACSPARQTELEPRVEGAKPEDKLGWGATTEIPGTPVMRIDLVEGAGKGFSSGYGGAVRNVLFLDPADKAGRWLLPDSQHFFAESLQLIVGQDDPRSARTLGTAALVKTVGQRDEAATGRLLLFDAVGRTVEWLADGVRRLNAASVGASGEWVVLYERNQKFSIAVVDGKTLKTIREQTFDIPTLK
jgi:hypothetical protein